MNIFKGQNLLEFADQFKTDEDCKKYLADNELPRGRAIGVSKQSELI